jgi:Fe2+ or Zn2+ uptake regulation protein
MMKSVEALVDIFRQNGFKITPQRRAIFELIHRENRHLTATEIYQYVTAYMPDISHATVYNTLRELTQLGELTIVENLGEEGIHYDTNTLNHHHLFCLGCHALVDISRTFEGLQLTSEEEAGYQVIKSQVTFYGYCPECQHREEKGEKDLSGPFGRK